MHCGKLIVIVMIFFPVAIATRAQIIDIKKTAENAAINQANQTINNDINTGINTVFQAPGKIFRKIRSNSQSSQNTSVNTPVNTNTNNTVNTNSNNSVTPEKAIYSTDFRRGQASVMSDDFSANDVGGFPDQWITNGSGEVRTIDGQNGKWLQLSGDGIFAPASLQGLPENFTLEYDAIFNPDAGPDVHYIFYLYSVKDKIGDFKETNYPGNAGIYFAFNTNAGEVDAESFEGGKAGIIDLHMVTDLLKSSLANTVHVALSRQKSKLNLYINGNRIFSSPSALPLMYSYDAIKFGSFYMSPDDFMLISNIRIDAN